MFKRTNLHGHVLGTIVHCGHEGQKGKEDLKCLVAPGGFQANMDFP